MTLSNYQPYMAYLKPESIMGIKQMSKATKRPIASILRDAVDARLAGPHPYDDGFNAGLEAAVKAVFDMSASSMRFPSGKSFAELVDEELSKLRKRTHETT